jgi:bifunctional non-homologous end joining protein LigD
MADTDQRATVAGHIVSLSNLDKVLYPGERIVKAEVVQYYLAVAPIMLEHVRDRPLALVRYPDGLDGESFFQKARPDWAPDWVGRVQMEDIEYVAATTEAVFVWLANLAALEIHQWHGRAPRIEFPDYLVIDIDPPKDGPFDTVRKLAFLLRDYVRQRGYHPYVKTTGGRGLHLVLPLEPVHPAGDVLEAARDLATGFRDEHPKAVTMQLSKAKRGGRVFLDILRHNTAQTVVSPYSLRGRPGATASLPITWEELDDLSDPDDFNIRTVPDILEQRGDAWSEIASRATALHTARPAGDDPGHDRNEPPRSLRAYSAKRRSGATPEPPAAVAAEATGDRFTIQRHHASRLHYDLRLERDGVLLSWAVPKGFPPRPGITRLAVRTEDHPLEYLDFEGTIPAGNYGAGRMWVFDTGRYGEIKRTDRSLTFELAGRGFSGSYRIAGGDGDEWFLVRLDDPDPDWPRARVEPMKAVLRKEPPVWDAFEYEVKWDGIRSLIHVDEGEIRIVTRNGVDVTEQFPELVLPDAFRTVSAVLDGEIVCLDPAGVPDFGAVLTRVQRGSGRAGKASRKSPAVCYVFDALYLDGRPITAEPLWRRRQWVEDLLVTGTPFRFSRSVSDGEEFLEAIADMGLEGAMAKRPESAYQVGRRSEDWLKLKIRRRASCTVVGYTTGRGSLVGRLAALHVAEDVDGETVYRGKVGSGITESLRRSLEARLAPLARDEPPLSEPPQDQQDTVWVEPRITCDVAFSEITSTGRFRAPSLKKVHPDPPASD